MPVVGERCSTSTNMTKEFFFKTFRKVSTHLCDGRLFEVNPDIQADFTNMPYEDKSFSMVVFDPPHFIKECWKVKDGRYVRKV